MTTERAEIWNIAKRDAQRQNKNVKKQKARLKVKSVIDGPVSIMKFILLLMTIYALYQYIPAFINFKKVISQTTTAQPGAQTLIGQRDEWGAASPLRDYIKMKKAYVRTGQSLQLQYVLPDSASATVTLKRCKAIPFIEVFKCNVVQAETIELKNETIGTKRFQIAQSGMYHLESQVEVTNDDQFDIIWRRG